MHRKVLSVAGLVLALLLAGASVALAMSPGEGAIKGRVIDSHGSPIANVEVDASDGWSGIANTAGDGSFVSGDIDPATYTVTFSDYTTRTHASADVTSVVVSADTTTDLGTIVMPDAGGISGTVTDDVGAPIIGASVYLLDPGNFPLNVAPSSLTGAGGKYFIPGANGWPNLGGDYLLVATAPDHVSSFYSGKATRAGADLVHFATGDSLAGRNFALVRAPRLDATHVVLTLVPAAAVHRSRPAVSGSSVVWTDDSQHGADNQHFDLFLKNGAGAPSAVATGASAHWDQPLISPSWVVYVTDDAQGESLWAYDRGTGHAKLIDQGLDFNSLLIGLDGNNLAYSCQKGASTELQVGDLAANYGSIDATSYFFGSQVSTATSWRLYFRISKGKIIYGDDSGTHLYDVASKTSTDVPVVANFDGDDSYDCMAFDYPNFLYFDPWASGAISEPGVFGSPVVVNVETQSKQVLSGFDFYYAWNDAISGRWVVIGSTVIDTQTGKTYRYDDTVDQVSANGDTLAWTNQGADSTAAIRSLSLSGLLSLKPWVGTKLSLSGAPSGKVKTSYKLSGKITPSAAGGGVKITLTCLVGKKVKSTVSAVVKLARGKFSYSFKPKYKGSWKAVATFAGQNAAALTYGPSSATKGFTVK